MQRDDIMPSIRPKNALQIRAERSSTVAELAGLNVRFNEESTTFQVTNISETGFAAITTPSTDTIPEPIATIKTSAGDEIYSGKIRLAWRNGEAAGYAFCEKFLSEALLKHLEICHFISEKAHQSLEMTSEIPPEFRDIIFRLRRFLKSLKDQLDAQDQTTLMLSAESKISFEEAMRLVFTQTIIPKMQQFNLELDNLLSTVNDKGLRRKITTVFRDELNSYLTLGPFTNRALHKPLGYAGDYEMMNQIYAGKLDGNSSFSKLMHLYGITEHSSLSVLERRRIVASRICDLIKRNPKSQFLSVACGPAKEITDVINTLSANELADCSFTLVDQDIEALLNAKRHISALSLAQNKKVRVNYMQLSVKDILEKSSAASTIAPNSYNFIYTMGLYDYLVQPIAKLLTLELVNWLCKDGVLFIGNFNPKNPTKAISELSVDWKLISRTDEEMRDLVPKEGVSGHKISHDSQGIEVLLEIVK